jgi:hypothetical protein
MQMLKELRCERVVFHTLEIVLYKYILAHLRLHTL